MKPADLLARWNAGNTGAGIDHMMLLIQLWQACESEVDAKCEPLAFRDGVVVDICYGENHIESCPVEIARQDRLSALNALMGFR